MTNLCAGMLDVWTKFVQTHLVLTHIDEFHPTDQSVGKVAADWLDCIKLQVTKR